MSPTLADKGPEDQGWRGVIRDLFADTSRHKPTCDVIAGHVQMMFATASSVVPHIRDGMVRALAVASLKRTAVLPDLPTIDELGIKNFDATTWHGLVAPAHTPREVVATLNRALGDALADGAVKTSLADLGVDIIGGTPEEFAAYIKSEIPKWTAIIKASGAKLE
jgi:tripartite-type tricarboxylate transporter receptor subunit TctC